MGLVSEALGEGHDAAVHELGEEAEVVDAIAVVDLVVVAAGGLGGRLPREEEGKGEDEDSGGDGARSRLLGRRHGGVDVGDGARVGVGAGDLGGEVIFEGGIGGILPSFWGFGRKFGRDGREKDSAKTFNGFNAQRSPLVGQLFWALIC